METTYYALGSKMSFNKALRHFYTVTDAVEEVESNGNIADYLNNLIDNEELNREQILPVIGAVLKDKFLYSYYSFSVKNTITDFEKIANETCKWTALDLVIMYFAPDGARFVINPKDTDSWERTREIHNDQLLVIYSKALKEKNPTIEIEAAKTLRELISGKDAFINKNFVDPTVVPKKKKQVQQSQPQVQMQPESAVANRFNSSSSAPVAAAPAGVMTGAKATPAAQPEKSLKKKTITPKYGVLVSNELFHNGNVEAWKKILESYQAKFPELTVHIMYGNEVINDINSLFKWGKVKHGDSIFFQVSGEEILGVSKLQKYLAEGASPRYAQFLKLGVGRVLNLF